MQHRVAFLENIFLRAKPKDAKNEDSAEGSPGLKFCLLVFC